MWMLDFPADTKLMLEILKKKNSKTYWQWQKSLKAVSCKYSTGYQLHGSSCIRSLLATFLPNVILFSKKTILMN
jgi:hypothetical protein